MLIRHFVWSAAAIAAALSAIAFAQPAPTGYHTVYCVKVKPGLDTEFDATRTGDLLKLEQYEVNSGRVSAYYVLATMTPAGSDARCDYAFVEFYPGLPPAPQSDAEQEADLHKAGVDKTEQQFGSELEASGTLVCVSAPLGAIRTKSLGNTKSPPILSEPSELVAQQSTQTRVEWTGILFPRGARARAIHSGLSAIRN